MTLQIIGGLWKGRRLKTPPSSITRPTGGILREAVFNMCQQEIAGALFLDLCAGSGAMGLEALSRGALHATFIEKNPLALKVIRENIELLNASTQTTIIPYPAEKGLSKLKTPFDIIYLDPPYDTPVVSIVGKLLDYHLMKEGTQLFIEEKVTKQNTPPTFPSLLHLKTKKFGGSLLHQFIPINNN